MSALLTFPLNLTTYCDYTQSFTFTAPANPVQFTGATARLQARQTPFDQTPLLDISTTPSASGAIYLGQAPPGPYGGTVSNVAELATFDASSWLPGTMIEVTGAQPAFYSWNPGGTQPADGITIVAGTGGNWLLTGTIVVQINRAAMLPLVGISNAKFNLLVTFASGARPQPYIEGPVYVDQSQTQIP